MLYNYRGYVIEPFLNGYTVGHCGDEVFFDTEDKARAFIDEIASETEV